MQKDLKVRTPSLAGGSELVVLAPLRPGFVPGLDTVTYKTRAKQLLATLHAGRRGQFEHRLLRVLSDAVERVGVIHTVRVAVLEPEDKILLSVNFDGSYEAYVRVIWQKASRLLDLIFCNSVGYVTGWDHSFDDWSRWLRSVQVETPFFYARPGVTSQDQVYLSMLERADRQRLDSDLDRTRIAVPTAEEIAWRIVAHHEDPTDTPQPAPPAPPQEPAPLPTGEGIRQGLQALAGLYRLLDVYPTGCGDDILLLRGAEELLPEFCALLEEKASNGAIIRELAGERLQRQVEWLSDWLERGDLPAARRPPPLPDAPPAFDASNVQGGILRAYDGVTDGCLCLMAFDGAGGAASFLGKLQNTTTTDAASTSTPPGTVLVNVAFTVQGLRACGLGEAELEWFPIEFRQGMEARAGLLGDVRGNHPRRWNLPRRDGPRVLDTAGDGAAQPAVALDAVHAVLQLRIAGPQSNGTLPQQALTQRLRELVGEMRDVRPLAVQWMHRMQRTGADGRDHVVDHFGFTDGLSQPRFDPHPQDDMPEFPNQVHLGEVLVGHDNAADGAADQDVGTTPARQALMKDGSFLVVRKLRQNVALLEQAVAQAVTASAGALSRDLVLAKMMGRWPAGAGANAGRPLVPTGTDINDFNYLDDGEGRRCPLGAHIRRANPRDVPPSQPKSLPGARPARLVRRSLPYGPPIASGDDADRGLMFMAYNASIAEQFEVVQRWLAGGNSSRGYSGAACPFLGVPEAGRRRHYRFEHNDTTVRMALDGDDRLGAEPRPIVSLQWGLYLFAPSIEGLARLREHALRGNANVAWTADEGALHIQRLRRIERDQGVEAAEAAWKAALEDPDAVGPFVTASIWAAVRRDHGGVLRIPYGVVVADRALVDDVLANRRGRYSVTGYQQRLTPTIGPIYLGLDDGAEYRSQSRACNEAIQRIEEADGFACAHTAAGAAIDRFVAEAERIARSDARARWDVTLDFRDLVDRALAALCEQWFGLSSDEAGPFMAGGFDWNWQPGQPALYPGHFTAPSRYAFQPSPGPAVEALAVLHGNALRRSMRSFIASGRDRITAPVTRAVLDDVADDDAAARTIVGAMMGFLPPADGGLRRVFNEWTRDGTLWQLRARAAPLETWDRASKVLLDPLRRTMQARPAPEQIWRTVLRSHRLGRSRSAQVAVRPGDRLILALASATQQRLESPGPAADVSPIFGGVRDGAAGQPTHACPGYKAAMGAMVGVLAALLGRTEDLRPGPAPGTVTLEGRVELEAEAGEPVTASRADKAPSTPGADRRRMFYTAAAARVPGQPRRELLAFGDSWFHNDYATSGSTDLRWVLANRGYDTSRFEKGAKAQRRLGEMHEEDPRSPGSFYGLVRRAVMEHAANPSIPLPAAILLGGGGNDVVNGLVFGSSCTTVLRNSPLYEMLKSHGSTPAVDPSVLGEFLDRMGKYLDAVVDRLVRATQGKIPILVHAYDHPVPDGRPSHRALCPSLQSWFSLRGYGKGNMDAAAAVMKGLIDAMNDRYAQVVGRRGTGDNVRFVRLAGTLGDQADFGDDHRKYWDNELHPTKRGFELLAEKFVAEIDAALAITPPH
jgi:Dyp-type peroxidase family